MQTLNFNTFLNLQIYHRSSGGILWQCRIMKNVRNYICKNTTTFTSSGIFLCLFYHSLYHFDTVWEEYSNRYIDDATATVSGYESSG